MSWLSSGLAHRLQTYPLILKLHGVIIWYRYGYSTKQEHEHTQHNNEGSDETARQSARHQTSLTARHGIGSNLPIRIVGDGVLERRFPGGRDVLERVKEILGGRSIRRQFIPTPHHQPPQSIRKTQ